MQETRNRRKGTQMFKMDEEESLKTLENNPWLLPMLKSKLFHEQCSEHITKKRCYFCCDCMTAPFCDLCLKKINKHDGHNLIQTYRSSYQSGVRVQTISKFMDTSDILIYVINSHKIIYINQRGEKGRSWRNKVTRRCEVCGWGLDSSSSAKLCGWGLDSSSSAKFCSIECKFRWDLGSKLDELMENQEAATTQSHEVPEVPVGRHKRKGIPCRSPLF